jgi:multidrug efflux pump subunit AcrA (membrane-fusion protein)
LVETQVERINDRVAAVGSGRARQQVTLTTRVAGVITEVLFEGGSQVKRDNSRWPTPRSGMPAISSSA